MTHPVVKVLGEGVDEDHLPRGCRTVQTDAGVEVVVPKHGAAHQCDEQRYDQHRHQSDEPTQDRHTCGTGEAAKVAAA